MGNIGTSPLLDLLLDERAEREDVDFRVVGSGPKMQEDGCREVAQKMLEFNPDLVLIVSPNPALPGPTLVRKMVAEAGKPLVVVGDAPGKKVVPDLEKEGMGYLLIEADSMIGARREFLDPAEMAIFNSNVIKVLAATGAFNVICEELEKAIQGVKEGSPYLPRVIITRQKAVEAADFQNPYALAKAMAAYEMAKKVADLSVEGCFKMREMKEYVPTVASSHEMMETAARLASEARELEKSSDSLLRKPHASDGRLLSKRKLMEKPS